MEKNMFSIIFYLTTPQNVVFNLFSNFNGN